MKLNFNVNKIILTILVILMILPYSIYLFGISLAKIVTVLVGLLFIYLVYSKRIEIKECLKNRFVIFNIIFALTILVSLIANYQTILFNDLYEVTKYVLFAMITIIIIYICREKENYLFLLKAISIVMIIISIFGIIQYFNPFSINELYIKTYASTQYETLVNDYPTPRIVGTKSNPSVYGILMSLGVYFNLIYYKYAKKKSIIWISLALCIINLMMTLTRTIQIAFICSIVAYIMISIWLSRGWKKAILALGLSILIIFLFLMLLPSEFTWRLFQVFNLGSSTSFMARISKWGRYIGLIQNNFILGIGPIKNYISEIGYVDSEWIQIILQYGVLGLTSYVIMLLSPIHNYLKSKNNKNILKYFIPILIIIAINNISASTLISFESAIGVYMIIGLILSNPDKITTENKE